LGLGASTINRHLAGLRVFLEWAVSTGRLAANPLARVSGLPISAPQPVWLERNQQAQLVRALARAVAEKRAAPRESSTKGLRHAVRAQAIVLLMLHTGIGVGELVALRLADVTLTAGGGSLCVFSRSTRPAARTLVLNSEVRQALAAYLALCPLQPEQRLFAGQRGALGVRQVQRILHKCAWIAGLPPALLTAQVLRYTFGRNLVQAGAPLEQVARLLGCTSLNPLRRLAPAPQPDAQQTVESIVVFARDPSGPGGAAD